MTTWELGAVINIIIKNYVGLMRLFLALNFNNSFKEAVSHIYLKLKKSGVKGNYTLLPNLHMTLAFLGETIKVDEIKVKKVIESVNFTPFELTFNKLDSFVNCGKEIVYLATKNDTLITLVSQLRSKLKNFDISFDEKNFRAHITLLRNAVGFSSELISINKLTASVESIDLMHPHRVDGVLTYTRIY